MNLRLMLLLVLIMLPLTVYADEGRTFELDFKAKDQYSLILEKSDRVLFEYGKFNHTIIVDEIKANTTELDIFLFLEKGLHNPDYQFLGKDYEIRLNFDKEGNKEMSIRLIDNDINKGTSNMVFKRLPAWDENAVLDLSSWKVENEKVKPSLFSSNLTPYIAGMIIVAFILFIFSVYYYNKRKGIYF